MKNNIPVSKTREYNSWRGMKERCLSEKHKNFNRYGGRGITICERWTDSFYNFLEDMGNRPDGNYSLDRIDNNKGYYKENCKWSSQKEQTNNIERNIIIMGLSPIEIADKLGISYNTVIHRINSGWADKDIISRKRFGLNFSYENIIDIYKRYRNREPVKKIANSYNVHMSSIYRILNDKKYGTI